MADTTIVPLGKKRMLKSRPTRRGRTSSRTKRCLTPLHAMRLARIMTQAQLAGIVGVDRSSIARYESGKDVPPADQRTMLACVLGTIPEALWPPGEVLDRLLAS